MWALFACKGEAPEEQVILEVKAVVEAELRGLEDAAVALRQAAPDAAWAGGAELDPSKAAWRDARVAYERIEGAIAVLFPELDASTDERYDGFLADLGPDDDLFDGERVTGVHAVERILWADAHPAAVVTFESALPGYTAAAFPATDDEAARYRDALLQRLVDDVGQMHEGFEPLALDAAAAYEGVVGSMAEQVEKVALAASGEDESRYAQHTVADMRANLDGGLRLYQAFSPWVADAEPEVDADVLEGFARVSAALDAVPGDAMPAVPATWDPDAPSAEDLATPYGELWAAVDRDSDPDADGSLVERMVAAAAAIDLAISP
ncbi:MAG: imelysin family protein [Myxococcota bacterium]